MANLSFFNGRWTNLDKPGGAVFFVSGGTAAYKGIGGSDSNDGLRPESALSTITAALSKTVSGRGDSVIILPGTITVTAAITVDEDDVTISGLSGSARVKPSAITANLSATGDVFGVTGANVTFEDLHFNASSAANTSRINAGAAGLTVRNCSFVCGASDLETITVPAAGTDLLVEGCTFDVTANGPDAAIEIEAAGVTRAIIRNNVFNGGNDTNAWDAGAINSGVAHTQCLVTGNVNNFGSGIIFTAAATGAISYNILGEGTLGSMLDPGSCMCFENYEADAIDETGRIFPTGVAAA